MSDKPQDSYRSRRTSGTSGGNDEPAARLPDGLEQGPSANRSRARWWWALAVFGFCLFPFGLVWWVTRYGVEALQAVTEGREAERCEVRLKKLWQGLSLYAEQNDARFPPADSWVDASWTLMPKQKPDDSKSKPKDPSDESESVFRCPAISKSRTGEYGFAFFSTAGGRSDREFDTPETTPLVFDSTLMVRNANSNLESLPKPPRHRMSRVNNLITATGSLTGLKLGESP